MKKYLKKLPLELKKIINLVRDISKESRMPAYLVGGFVRDLFLGVENFDLDITVEGNGISFARRLAKKLKSKIIIYERFGTASLTLNNCLKVDLATTRKERYPTLASLPVVSLGSLKEDLGRRDFTINAMAINISQDESQVLIDPFGGKNDLKKGIIRILHNNSFRDDPTRILRAIRFEQRFNFRIEAKTLALLKQAIKDGLLNKVHAHRMRDDLISMLKEDNPFRQIKRLADLKGLVFLNAGLRFNKTTQRLFKLTNNQICWFIKNYPGRRQLDIWLIYLIVLLKPLSLPVMSLIVLKLGLRKGEIKRIINFYQKSQKIISSLNKKGVTPQHIFSLLEPVSYEEIVILRVVCQDKYLKKYIADFLEIYNGMKLCIKGHDLHGLGVLPGPRYQKIFTQVLTAKLNGLVKNRREELILIKKLILD
jgi:tRNA nucleotidyltransferase (CCA-adding enzyme)